MTHSVRLNYARAGVRAPVFVVTSLSHPQWAPVEMHCSVQANDEHHFHRDFTAVPGTYQYKFRLGHGDEWDLDHSKPIGTV